MISLLEQLRLTLGAGKHLCDDTALGAYRPTLVETTMHHFRRMTPLQQWLIGILPH